MVKISDLRPGHIPQVQAVALSSWLHAYHGIHTERKIRTLVRNFYTREKLERAFPRIKAGKARFLVAQQGRKVVGYYHVDRTRHGWELFRIYLEPSALGKGIGQKLLDAGEAWLKLEKAKKYFLFVQPRNLRARRFYEKNGFKQSKRKIPRDAATRDSLVYEKRLPPRSIKN